MDGADDGFWSDGEDDEGVGPTGGGETNEVGEDGLSWWECLDDDLEQVMIEACELF